MRRVIANYDNWKRYVCRFIDMTNFIIMDDTGRPVPGVVFTVAGNGLSYRVNCADKS